MVKIRVEKDMAIPKISDKKYVASVGYRDEANFPGEVIRRLIGTGDTKKEALTAAKKTLGR